MLLLSVHVVDIVGYNVMILCLWYLVAKAKLTSISCVVRVWGICCSNLVRMVWHTVLSSEVIPFLWLCTVMVCVSDFLCTKISWWRLKWFSRCVYIYLLLYVFVECPDPSEFRIVPRNLLYCCTVYDLACNVIGRVSPETASPPLKLKLVKLKIVIYFNLDLQNNFTLQPPLK